MRRTSSRWLGWLLCGLVLTAGAARAEGDLAEQLAQALVGIVDHAGAAPVALPISMSRRGTDSVRVRFGRHKVTYTVRSKPGEAEREEFVIGSRRHPVKPLTPVFSPMDPESITATALRVGTRNYVALQGSGTGLAASGRAQRYVFVHVFAVHRTALALDPPVSFANLYLGARAIGRLPEGRLGVALIEAREEAGRTRFTARPMAVNTTARSITSSDEAREIGRLREDGVFARSLR